MNCDNCRKEKATVHIKAVAGDVTKSIHLCPECAAVYDIDGENDDHLKLAALLIQLTAKQHAAASPPATTTGAACADCGTTELEFRETGRLGCSACYQNLRQLVIPALDRLHKGTQHAGKRPGASVETEPDFKRLELRELTKELDEAVAVEDYERAAEIRDLMSKFQNAR